MREICLSVVLAYILDLILGDPAWLPHPVRGIGYLAKKLEPSLRKSIRNQRTAGIIFAVVIIGLGFLAVFAIIHLAGYFNRYLGLAFSTFFIYTSLAVKGLNVESTRVYEALKINDMGLARKNLSLIVGRDTENLGPQEIIRATVETVAENITDAIIAPIFYAFLGGAALTLAYKAANTLDSMVGYKNEKYKDFGWCSARIDDCLNFIPARVSGLIMPLAVSLLGLNALSSFRVVLRDGEKNPSPNSGIPEAAIAGALGVRLGGLNYYGSVIEMKPFIGDDLNTLSLMHIKKSISIAYVSALLSITLGVALIYIL